MSANKPKGSSLLSTTTLIFIISVAFAIITAYMWVGKAVEQSREERVLELLNYTCAFDPHLNWEIDIYVKNSGDNPLFISYVYVKNMEVSKYGTEPPSRTLGTITTDLEKREEILGGEVTKVRIWVGARFGFLIPGSKVNVKILTARGTGVEKSISLP